MSQELTRTINKLILLDYASFSKEKINFIQFSDTSPDLTCNIWITPFFHPSNRYPFLSPLFPVDVGKEHRVKLHLTRARVLEKTGHLLSRVTSKEIFLKVCCCIRRQSERFYSLKVKTCKIGFLFLE